MNIQLARVLPIEAAFAALRKAPLERASEKEIFLYEDAVIRLADLDPEDLNPTSLYLLEEHLAFQRRLRDHLQRRFAIDPLELSAVLHLETPEGIVGMMPPFVEVIEEEVQFVPLPGDRPRPGSTFLKVPVLKDGLHRAYLARELGVPIRCIVVRTPLSREYRTYAYPNHWSEVEVHASIPARKKHYRRADPYTFMRPITSMRLLETPVREWGR